MSFIILDLDNCIADDQWRISRINWQHKDPMRRYHDYHSLRMMMSCCVLWNKSLLPARSKPLSEW